MKLSTAVLIAFVVLCAVLLSFVQLQTACANITWTGDIDPTDPTTWTYFTNGYVGKTADGTLMVDNGSGLLSYRGYVGLESGVTGEVTVAGAGSTWTNNGYFLGIGHFGSGTLNIMNGGAVNNDGGVFVSYIAGSSGTIHFDNGTLTTESLYSATDDLTGSGTINTHGLVSDVDLIFNATYGLNQILNLAGIPGQNITVNLSVDGSGAMGAGYGGVGTMTISDGRVVESAAGYLGYKSGSTGEVAVDGTGSTWTNDYNLYVGHSGCGILNITNGGSVSTGAGYSTRVAYNPGSSGTIHFDNGTLTTGTLFSATDDLTGTGTINTHGLVSDVDLVFDATHGLSQTFIINDQPGQSITVHLSVDGHHSMGAGYSGVGTMTISDGMAVESRVGYLGYKFGSTGEVTVDGTGSSWTNDLNLNVGYSGSGTLNITGGGAVISDSDSIGSYSGSTGVVTVNGAGSSWTNDYSLSVGREGSGTLNITGGGAVTSSEITSIGSSSGSTGVVSVDGAGSTWTNTSLSVGREGIGTLNITGGGAVTSHHGSIGSSSGSIGEVTVDGAGSTWMHDTSLHVGNRGIGTLNITGGGAVTSNYGSIGKNSGVTGEVTVDGVGSTWTNDSSLYVGHSGSGTLNIADGGAVTAEYSTWVAYNPGSSGTIHFDNGTLTTESLYSATDDLTGSGTINTHGLVSDVDLIFNATYGLNQILNLAGIPGQNITVNLSVDGSGAMGAGYGGVGTMTISDGRVIESTSGCLGHRFGSTGKVTIDGAGSTWTNSNHLYVGHSGSGTLNITGGGTVSNDKGYLGYRNGSTRDSMAGVSNRSGSIGSIGSGSTGQVTVDGAGSTWTNRNRLYVGYSGIGTLNIMDEGIVSVAGTLTIDVNGEGNDSINMATGGMLALNGDADDSLADFLGLIDGTDAIYYWNDSISTWDDITGATYGDNFTLIYLTEGDLAGYTLLTVGVGGDFDGDRDVDGVDFLKWQRGESPNPFSNTALDVWKANFGMPVSSVAAATTAIPEPSSIMLLLTAFACNIWWRWLS